jgi:hypothetical protein
LLRTRRKQILKTLGAMSKDRLNVALNEEFVNKRAALRGVLAGIGA